MKNIFGTELYTDLTRSALISPCGGKYRYWLKRKWGFGGDGKTVCFIMLNPSTADAEVDDPTVARCMGFVRRWGHSTLVVRNLFALRATDPGELLRAEDPVGPHGDGYLARAKEADLVIAAWGCNVPFGRVDSAMKLLDGVSLFCLGLTKGGCPRHPLYVKADAVPIPFRGGL